MSTALPLFDGVTYQPEHDHDRLTSQLAAVRKVLAYGEPLTLDEIETEIAALGVKGNSASISSRVRDLRKQKFGGYAIRCVRIDRGVFAYQMEAR